MNERIQQLAEQCYETGPIGKDGWPEYSKFNESKFAELIVKEVFDCIANEGFEVYGPVTQKVKKHFGVEE
jgi:hypothetical protein